MAALLYLFLHPISRLIHLKWGVLQEPHASMHRIGQLFKRCFARFSFTTLKASKCRLFRPSEIGK
jgi:hypothetical protein